MSRNQSSKLILICGPMFAGKTTKLIKYADKAELAGKKILIFKYIFDTRYSDNNIVTHDNVRRAAVPCQSLLSHLEACKSADFIGVDEGQFFPDLREFVEQLMNQQSQLSLLQKSPEKQDINPISHQKEIVIAALDGDFLRNPFGQTLQLIPICSKFSKLTSKSKDTGEIAPFSLRIINSSEIIVVGGSESYIPVSRSEYHNIKTDGFVRLIISSQSENEKSTFFKLLNEIKEILGKNTNQKVLFIKLGEYKEESIRINDAEFEDKNFCENDNKPNNEKYLENESNNNQIGNLINKGILKLVNHFLANEEMNEFEIIAVDGLHKCENGAVICDKLANSGKKVFVSAKAADENLEVYPEVSKMIPMSESILFLTNKNCVKQKG